ncbi:hypothetical protein SAMN02745219_01805 [Desulfofundulus thermosubterraneus DSM 16057]|uniref:Uncharacterized protein n=1 Tax=Desulfofundulus thermosubterraneus DSM 16057 TaxID=1121432 RepID=A0A1M6GRP4_9FIRM|nr:hypothetical protein SAMN02745219_01805 [Desulfofundulus thermosubterraneus DSM 16057]
MKFTFLAYTTTSHYFDYVQLTPFTHLTVPEMNPKPSAREVPFDCPLVWTNNSTGTTFQAASIVKTKLALFYGVKTSRAGGCTRFIRAAIAYLFVYYNVRVLVIDEVFVFSQKLFYCMALHNDRIPFHPSMASLARLKPLILISFMAVPNKRLGCPPSTVNIFVSRFAASAGYLP